MIDTNPYDPPGSFSLPPRAGTTEAISSRILLRLFLRSYAYLVLVFVWGGYWLLGTFWPTPFKLWLSTSMALSGIATSFFLKDTKAETLSPGRQSITVWQGVGVTLMTIMLSVYVAWLVVSP